VSWSDIDALLSATSVEATTAAAQRIARLLGRSESVQADGEASYAKEG
jgi:hypothetical protein